MRLARFSVARALLFALVLVLFLTMNNRAETVGFSYPKVPPDPKPLQILGPAGEIFSFVKTGATTDGRYVMAEAVIPPSAGPLPHIHHYTDEWFYFPDGGLMLETGDNTFPDMNIVPGINAPKEHFHRVKTTPGSLFYGPRYHVHGFTNPEKEPRRLVFVWTPDDGVKGITNYFKEVGQLIPDPSNPPPIDPKSKALFVSQAPKYGINQSSDYWQYVDKVDYNFPSMDNHAKELLALLSPDVAEGSVQKVGQPTDRLVIAGKFTAKPEKRKELIQLAQSLFQPSRSESGCISYNFYESSQDRNSFLFFEEWLNQEAIDKHFQTKHFKQFMEKFPEMIVGTPSMKSYEVRGVKELT